MLTEDQIIKEAAERNKDPEGGYHLLSIDAFVIGAMIAKQLHEEGKAPVWTKDIVEGYEWAVSELFH